MNFYDFVDFRIICLAHFHKMPTSCLTSTCQHNSLSCNQCCTLRFVRLPDINCELMTCKFYANWVSNDGVEGGRTENVVLYDNLIAHSFRKLWTCTTPKIMVRKYFKEYGKVVKPKYYLRSRKPKQIPLSQF